MEEKLLAFLKGKLQGTSESYLRGVAQHYAKTITDETQIETTLNDGVIGLLKLNAGILQTEGDRRATEATKTAVKNAFEKLGLDENGKPKVTQGDQADPTDLKSVLEKLLNDKLTPLQDKILGFEKEKTQSQLMGKLTSKLKEKGIPQSYYKNRNISIENDSDLETLTTAIESEYGVFRQELIDSGVVISVPKASTGQTNDGSFGAKIAERQNAGASSGVEGKKIEIIK